MLGLLLLIIFILVICVSTIGWLPVIFTLVISVVGGVIIGIRKNK